MQNNEFYIGWQPGAPKGYKIFVKRSLFVLFPLMVGMAFLLSYSQKKFATGSFELGKPTTVKGIYFNSPVPNIKVPLGKDILGNYSTITIPLVGYGKQGAETVIAALEKEHRLSLDKREISLSGALLYNEGKLLLQIDKNDDPLKSTGELVSNRQLLPATTELGVQKVRGEIVDPKCYFGVMKPGEGKPHRDCAIRCILGGIAPVMRVRNEKGEANYYIMLGPSGEKMNEAVKDHVAEPVEWEARLVQYDDWILMYVKDKEGPKRIPGSLLSGRSSSAIACH